VPVRAVKGKRLELQYNTKLDGTQRPILYGSGCRDALTFENRYALMAASA